MVAGQATELTLRTAPGNQFNAPVASFAFGTGDVGLLHGAEG
jgi:hypothetical protein